MAKKKGKPRGNGKAALILAATQVPSQPSRLPERVEDYHDDDDYIPDGDMIEEVDTNEEINDEEMNGAVQNHEDTMNEDQMNDELGIDPRQSNGREPTLKAPVDANGKVIVRCTRGMFLDYEVSHKAVAIMRQFFNGPWLSWREVPTHAKVGMWNKFEEIHTILPGQLHHVHQVWNKHCQQRLTTSLGRVRSQKLLEAKGDLNKARDKPLLPR
ncbi:uncharacterized protein LOC103695614 [Phoenix dactylifera]|uniref:Uncharacterized protein LOC103695614 n=1 Tax=Phoenix dactylifera TaxID=42345 RepID=A0A8B9A644_PHODC|nr:uncharacterized protein LOC103695614 [Phoenix dactylifera]